MEQNNVIEVKTVDEIGKAIIDFAQRVIAGDCSNPNGIKIVKYGSGSGKKFKDKVIAFNRENINFQFIIAYILLTTPDDYYDSLVKVEIEISLSDCGYYDICITERHAL